MCDVNVITNGTILEDSRGHDGDDDHHHDHDHDHDDAHDSLWMQRVDASLCF